MNEKKIVLYNFNLFFKLIAYLLKKEAHLKKTLYKTRFYGIEGSNPLFSKIQFAKNSIGTIDPFCFLSIKLIWPNMTK